MQCLIIFDHLNDVVYVKGNAKFDVYIRKQCIKDGLLREEDAFSWPGTMEYHNALMQFFSPIIASQRIMIGQFNSPYTGITCEDGTLMTFCQYLGYILVAIAEEKHVNESFLQRKLRTFCRLATFLCGPSFEILKTVPGESNDKHRLLGKLIDTWDFLYHHELPFLLEAQERLLTNADLNSLWVKLLQDVLEKVRGGIHNVSACHAFILIKTKLLALYSRNVGVISEGDILLLAVLASAYYPDLLPPSLRMESPSASESHHGSVHSSDSDQYFSPCSSPARTSTSADQFSFPSTDLYKDISSISIEEGTCDPAISQDNPIAQSEVAEGYVDITADFNCDLVFLLSSVSAMAPFLVHTIHITTGVALIIICMVNKHALSGSLASGIELLHDIQSQSCSLSAKAVIESLESNIRSITETVRKMKPLMHENSQFIKRLHSTWESAKKSGFCEFLRSKDAKHLPARLDRAVMELSSCLKEGFNKFCISWYQKDNEVNGSLIDSQAIVRFTLADYIDYLQVKAQRNISMATYYADFPGMVHFIFVDRIANQITVPSMDLGDGDTKDSSEKYQSVVWQKLYEMVHKAWSHLRMGHTSVVWRDDCFHYSYFIWFEDPMGNPHKPEQSCVSLEGFPLPGIICGNFFRQFTQACFPSHLDFIRCYELFCIHLTTVPPSLVNQQARRLTASIWEVSGAAQSPLDLLL